MSMSIGMIVVIFYLLFWLAAAGVGIYLLILIIKALKKYIGAKEVREEKREVKKTLAEVLREERIRCKMTQEFVAETIGVSRQAVSKWENGTTDPSTSNLIALAKLYGVSAEEMLRSVADLRNKDLASGQETEEAKR